MRSLGAQKTGVAGRNRNLMNPKILMPLLSAFLMGLGICIGVFLHTLDLIKNLILLGQANTLYRAPLFGVTVKLSYLWDLYSILIIVCFILACLIATLLGIIATKKATGRT